MITTIIKRDGRKVPLNMDKISEAIYKAFQVTGGKSKEEAIELANEVVGHMDHVLHLTEPSVEQIQDVVEKVLIENGHSRTAKEYILYRAERTRVREMNTRLMKTYEDLTFKESRENNIKRENANIDGDTAMGTMLKYGSEGAKQFYEMYVLHPEHARAHREGDIHIHDLDFLMLTTTCCQIDIEKLFEGGFSTGHGYLREPNDIASYSALACIAIQSNQNDQHGGQSIPNFDYGMAKGVAKTYRRIYRQNLARAIELLTDVESGEPVAKKLLETVKAQEGLSPVLANDNGYCEAEFPLLPDSKQGIKHGARRSCLGGCRRNALHRKGGNPMQTLIAILGVAFLTYWALRGISTVGTDDKERRVRRYVRQMDTVDRR